MFNRELPRLWSDAIVAGDATILAVPVNLLHLLTIQEPGEFRRRPTQEDEFRPSTPATPMPQIIMMPPHQSQLPSLAPQQYLPPPLCGASLHLQSFPITSLASALSVLCIEYHLQSPESIAY